MIVVGEAAALPKAVMQASNLHLDVAVLDLNICDGIAPQKYLFNAKSWRHRCTLTMNRKYWWKAWSLRIAE
jgi:hypothetical protein